MVVIGKAGETFGAYHWMTKTRFTQRARTPNGIRRDSRQTPGAASGLRDSVVLVPELAGGWPEHQKPIGADGLLGSRKCSTQATNGAVQTVAEVTHHLFPSRWKNSTSSRSSSNRPAGRARAHRQQARNSSRSSTQATCTAASGPPLRLTVPAARGCGVWRPLCRNSTCWGGDQRQCCPWLPP